MRKMLGKEDIIYLLKEMDRRLSFLNYKVEINIYGGAVMSLCYNSRRSTQDIDSMFKDIDIIYPLVIGMAEELDLDDDWFNNTIEDIKSVLLEEEMISTEWFVNIDLKIPSAQQMLAMKFYAARNKPKKDFEDAVIICRSIGVNTEEQAMSILGRFIDQEVITDRQIRFLKHVIKEVNNAARDY